MEAKDLRTKHILGHLQKSEGSQVSIGILGASKGKATVFPQDDGRLKLQIENDTLQTDNNEPEVTLILAMCFPKRLKTLWPMIASFGYVRRIIIIRGKLSDSDYCKSSTLKPHVYSPLIEEGMSQGGHTRPIQVDIMTEHMLSREELDKLLSASPSDYSDDDQKCEKIKTTAKVLLDCEGTELLPAREVVLTKNTNNQQKQSFTPSVIVAVGPERGWTEEEAVLFKDYGFIPATLGLNNIFRVDTAVIAGLAIISTALEESLSQQQSLSKKQHREEITASTKRQKVEQTD